MTIVEAARVANVSVTSIHRLIRRNLISATPVARGGKRPGTFEVLTKPDALLRIVDENLCSHGWKKGRNRRGNGHAPAPAAQPEPEPATGPRSAVADAVQFMTLAPDVRAVLLELGRHTAAELRLLASLAT